MTPRLIVEGGSQRQHRHALETLLDETNGLMRIASAYITDNDLVLAAKSRPIRLLTSLVRMDLVSGATSLPCLRSLIQAGVHCRSTVSGGRLHAKVYIFDNAAIVTSANLTKSALDVNMEVGVQVIGKAVEKLASWFDALWKEADVIDARELSKWEDETEDLRQQYAALRRKAGLILRRRRSEAIPSVRCRARLRDLLDNAPRCFVCNTNRRWSDDAEDLMRKRKFAAVWEDFKFPTHMERVKQGDAIFMFAKGAGIIGVGQASAKCEVRPPSDRRKISAYSSPEWRVPVEEWLAWVEHDSEACPCTIPNASFIDVSGDNYLDMRESIRKHFLRDSS